MKTAAIAAKQSACENRVQIEHVLGNFNYSDDFYLEARNIHCRTCRPPHMRVGWYTVLPVSGGSVRIDFYQFRICPDL
jgi:hypothetical protein